MQEHPPPLAAFLDAHSRPAFLYDHAIAQSVHHNACFSAFVQCGNAADTIQFLLQQLVSDSSFTRIQSHYSAGPDRPHCVLEWTATTVGSYTLFLATSAVDTQVYTPQTETANFRKHTELLSSSPIASPPISTLQRRTSNASTQNSESVATHSSRPWHLQPRFRHILTKGGEMGQRIREFDWASTPLGPMERWSTSLASSVAMILQSQVPMGLYWGQSLIIIYNDAYARLVGPVKKTILGQQVSQGWAEIYHIIEPLCRDALNGKECYIPPTQLYFDRMTEGKTTLEEVFVDWSYTPIAEVSGEVAGLLVVIHEHSERVINERRIFGMNKLAQRLAPCRSMVDLCRFSCDVLSTLDQDIFYGMVYTVSPHDPDAQATTQNTVSSAYLDGNTKRRRTASNASKYNLTLQETIRLAFDSKAAPSNILVDTADGTSRAQDGSLPVIWPFAEVVSTKSSVVSFSRQVEQVLSDKQVRASTADSGFIPERAISIPLIHGDEVIAIFVFCLSPTLKWDKNYQTFIDLISRQLNSLLAVVKAAEDEAAKLESIEALDRAKTAFFTGVSHELRTPLTLILGPCSELLSDSSLTKAQSNSLSLVQRNARRLLRLVNSLLDFSKAEAGRVNVQYESVDISAFTLDLASSFRSAIEGAGIVYTTQTSCEHQKLFVDREKYEKIVFNIVGNAFKYTTAGEIEVSCDVEGDSFVFTVRDTGFGIPSQDLSAIFEKFRRVESSAAARTVEGSGIGLSLALEFVKLHQGTIEVESVVDKGSTFKVFMPLGSAHLPADKIIESTGPASVRFASESEVVDAIDDEAATWDRTTTSGSRSDSAFETTVTSSSFELWRPMLFNAKERPTILLADDHADMRKFIINLFQPYCNVIEAKNGMEAWEIVQSQEVDLILSDVQMPRMTGFELLRLVREDATRSSLPFILISARAGDEARVEGLAAGADDHISKPFSAKELILRAHTLLQLHAMRIELENRVAQRTQELRASEASFKQLADSLQVAVHRSDLEGKIYYANKAWFSVLGLDPAIANDWSPVIHADDRESAVEAYFNCVKTHVGYQKEMRLVVEGRTMEIIYDLTPERMADGTVIGFIGTFTDVTRLRQLEKEHIDQERRKAESAEENRKMLENFIDVVCHELRNPLNGLMHSAIMLSDSLLNGRGQIERSLAKIGNPDCRVHWLQLRKDWDLDVEAVQTIMICANHQKRIADDVLHISKLSANLIDLTYQPFSPLDEVKSVLSMFKNECASKQIELSLEIHPSYRDLRIHSVDGDSGRFCQIVINLVANSVKFSEGASQKSIQISLGASYPDTHALPLEDTPFSFEDTLPQCENQKRRSDATSHLIHIHVAVTDHGGGMTEDEQSRVFERFAQATPKTYRNFGGTGLGLFISKELVQMHGGKIALQSQKGVGTIFRFYIAGEHIPSENGDIPTIDDTTPAREAPVAIVEIPATPQPPPVELPICRPCLPSTRSSAQSILIETPSPPSSPLNSTPDYHVLLVEDNIINSRVLSRLMIKLGCQVSTAIDGQDCLNQLNEALAKEPEKPPYHLILMDLEMPIMNGLDASSAIRKLEELGPYPGRIPIVAVSGNARQEYAERAMQVGMQDFLRKPYSKAELERLLAVYAGRF